MGMKRRPRRESVDEVLLARLCHEGRSTDRGATDERIRRSLRYYGYDVEQGMLRVPRLREFKNRLLKEFSQPLASSYYRRTLKDRGFAAMRDFDLLRLRDDMAEAFPSVDHGLVGGFVNQAIYLYYLR